MITRDATVKTDIPNNIKVYLCDLLSEDIESTLSKIEKPLGKDVRPLFLWTRKFVSISFFTIVTVVFKLKAAKKLDQTK